MKITIEVSSCNDCPYLEYSEFAETNPYCCKGSDYIDYESVPVGCPLNTEDNN